MFSDLSKPNRAGWRTGAVIHELEREARRQPIARQRHRHRFAAFPLADAGGACLWGITGWPSPTGEATAVGRV